MHSKQLFYYIWKYIFFTASIQNFVPSTLNKKLHIISSGLGHLKTVFFFSVDKLTNLPRLNTVCPSGVCSYNRELYPKSSLCSRLRPGVPCWRHSSRFNGNKRKQKLVLKTFICFVSYGSEHRLQVRPEIMKWKLNEGRFMTTPPRPYLQMLIGNAGN